MNTGSSRRTVRWQTGLWALIVAAAVAWALASDVAHLKWVAQLSSQGSAAPERAANSPTGYALGQRQFLGARERGDTFRWIAMTQDLLAHGLFDASRYQADNVPTGRPQLLPRLYAGWLVTVAWTQHAVTGEPLPLAAERAALWEPVLGHVLIILLVTAFMAARCGPVAAAFAALLVSVHPLCADQFLAGTLSVRPWALILAAIALGTVVAGAPVDEKGAAKQRLNTWSAVAAGLSLWLDPEIGFPSVLLLGLAGITDTDREGKGFGAIRWSGTGAALVMLGWACDRAPWEVSAGELRYVHPYYALAWLGLGLVVHGWQARRSSGWRRRAAVAAGTLGLLLTAPLVVAQITHHDKGWLYPSAAMRRLTSLNEATVSSSLAQWIGSVSPATAGLVLVPTCAAVIALVVWSFTKPANESWRTLRVATTLLYVGLLVLACARVRWLVVTSLLAVPLCWQVATLRAGRWRQRLAIGAMAFVGIVIAWTFALPPELTKPAGAATAQPADVDALIYRHLAHWLASHSTGHPVAALAPPELSDALVYQGGCRVLVSTAWESYDGQVAASRILSSPEATEADAVLQSREITHVILTSWDKVLPLLVREPKETDRTTLYARLQRWVVPPYLRPLPYRLPPTPGYEAEKIAVFKVTGAQDESLALSRLAEYFAEVGRPEPATAAAEILARSFADDPNAQIARATVAVATGNREEFDRELNRLARDLSAGNDTLPWDRRVQRAVIFAFGGQQELARSALASCLAQLSPDELAELTPLQAYRLLALMRRYHLEFADSQLAAAAAALGAEYQRK
jgi:hypothetical protein